MEASTAAYTSAASLLTIAQGSQPPRTNILVSKEAPTVTVTLSDTAQAFLATSTTQSTSSAHVDAAASKAVDNLLSSSGSAIYVSAINSLKVSPADLGVQAGNPNLTDSQKLALWDQVNARQYAAYGHIGYGDDVGLSYAKAQIEYAQSLSPAERQVEGFTDESILGSEQWINGYEAQQGKAKTDYSISQNPILALFDALKNVSFNADDKTSSKIIKNYKQIIDKLIINKSNPERTSATELKAISRFKAVQNVIYKAQIGSNVAFNHLKNPADQNENIDEF